jgi:CheY-like chemotaxis protein
MELTNTRRGAAAQLALTSSDQTESDTVDPSDETSPSVSFVAGDEEATHARKIKTRHVSVWSSNLTGFVNSKNDTACSALLQAKWALLAVAFLFALIYGGVVVWRVVSLNKAVRGELLEEQVSLVNELRAFVTAQLNGKVEDVYRLGLVPTAYSTEFFTSWARADYDLLQVRYINNSGWETIRIDYDLKSRKWMSSADSLQDKSNREYTNTTLGLEPASVYISSIDLNVEFGEVQLPYRPVYRVASPVFTTPGDISSRSGFVISNLDAAHLWQRTTRRMNNMEWDVLDLNLHWLASSNPDTSILYGQSLPERANIIYRGPLAEIIKSDIEAEISEVHHADLSTGLVISYSLLSPPFSDLKLHGDNGLVLLLRAPEGYAWSQAQQRLTGFYAAIALAYIATVAMCGVIAIFWHSTKAKEQQNKQSHEFLASVSHDLRSPLHVMSNALHLLESEELLRKYEFRALQAAVESMLSLLSNTVFIYRSGTDKHVPPQKRNLKDDFVTLCEVSAFLANEKDLFLELELDDALPAMVMVNWIGVKQILVNLLSNAIKFTVSGGITVRVKVCEASGSQVCLRLSVTDSGPGLPKVKPKEKPTPKGAAQGLGLGICERIASSLNATLEVNSIEGQGATFVVDHLLCDVIEPVKPARVWNRLATQMKALHFVTILDRADAQHIRPKLEAFLHCLRRHMVVTMDMYVGEDLFDSEFPDIPPNSIVWFGIIALQHDRLMNSVVSKIKASGSSAAILSFICGSLSLTDSTSMIGASFPHALVYPPWTPERLANQLAILARGGSPKGSPRICAVSSSGSRVVKEEVEYDYTKLRVLVVDDMAVNRKIMKRLLSQNFGIKADEAGGGNECMEKVDLGPPYDLILLDLHMPDMDGVDCAKAVRKLEENKLAQPCTIMGLSASVMDADRDACIKAGMNDYFCKPMSIEQLTRVMTDLLSMQSFPEDVSSSFSSTGSNRGRRGVSSGRRFSQERLKVGTKA